MTIRLRACSLVMALAAAFYAAAGDAATTLDVDAYDCQRAVGKVGQSTRTVREEGVPEKFSTGFSPASPATPPTRCGHQRRAGLKMLNRLLSKCTASLLFDAPPAGVGFAASCELPASSIDSDEAACQGLTVTTRTQLGECLICWKKAALNELVKIVNPCHAALLPAGSDLPCGIPPASCPADPVGIACQRTIAKAGIRLFLTREKAMEKCLDAVRAGDIAGSCPDPATLEKIAKAEAKKTKLVQKCVAVPPWWDVCPADCGLPITTITDVSACLSAAANPTADQVVCQQYPGADADGLTCPSPSPTTSTPAPPPRRRPPTTTSTSTSTSTTVDDRHHQHDGFDHDDDGEQLHDDHNRSDVHLPSGTQVADPGQRSPRREHCALTGHQDWHFAADGPDGLRAITFPATVPTSIPPPYRSGPGRSARAQTRRPTAPAHRLRRRPGAYGNTVQQDHNSNSSPDPFGADPTCTATFDRARRHDRDGQLEAAARRTRTPASATAPSVSSRTAPSSPAA